MQATGTLAGAAARKTASRAKHGILDGGGK